jgi:hypothetical protein
MPPVRIKIGANGIATMDEVIQNKKDSESYPRVSWDHFYKPCAVVGGGLSAQKHLDVLRRWPGDVYGINDTTEYLSNNNIPSFLYALDVTPIPYRTGNLVRGALFGSRVNKIQYECMKGKPIWVFDLIEENPTDGIEGGPTAVCRTPHLLLKMGYRKVYYFGIDGSFEDPNVTHNSGFSTAAYDNMIIVTAGGRDYYTNAAFMLQNECMLNYLTECKDYLVLSSDGLLKAMLDDPEWSYTAVADDLKHKYEANGFSGWTEKYTKGGTVWQPQEV